MSEWRVLHVDDKEDNHRRINEILNDADFFEDDSFDVKHFTNFEDALEWVRFFDVDLAILDVHDESDEEPESGGGEQKGEELLHRIKETRFFPVVFYTAYGYKVEGLRSMVVEVVQKGEHPERLVESVNRLLGSQVPRLQVYIRESIRSFMWEYLGEGSQGDKFEEAEPNHLSLLLARNLANKLGRESVKSELGIPLDKIVPLEMYQYPVEEDLCSPGAIVKDNGDKLWIVLTPACDFAQKRAKAVLIAGIHGIESSDVFKKVESASQKLRDSKKDKDAGKISEDELKVVVESRQKKVDKFQSFLRNNGGDRFRFLPGTFFLSDCFVDFQDVSAVPFDEASDYKAVCCLDSPFAEEMLHFFSRYYGRIGTPDVDVKLHWVSMQKSYPSLGD